MNDVPQNPPNRFRDVQIVLITLAVLVAPFIAGVAIRGRDAAVVYLSGDTYYYLVVARNIVEGRGASFDGEHPTNGFHPLWEGCTVAITAVGEALGLSRLGLLTLVLAASVALVGLSLLVLAGILRRLTGGLPWLFCLLPLGIHGAVAMLVYKPWIHGSLWGYADGMESSLVLLAWCLLMSETIRAYHADSFAFALRTGLLLSMLAMARLDHAFYVVAFFVWHAVSLLRGGTLRKAACLVVACAVPTAAVIAYMGLNRWLFGTFLPLSGAAKTTFPNIHWANYYDAIQIHSDWRIMQIFLPALAAGGVLIGCFWSRWRKARPELVAPLGITALSILLLAGYNLSFVPLCNQGNWYYPVSVMFVSVAPLLIFSRPSAAPQFLLKTVLAVILLVTCTTFYKYGNGNDYFLPVIDDARDVARRYPDHDTRMVVYDDGLLAYFMENRVLNGYRLVIDADIHNQSSKEGRPFLEVAIQRGYDRIACWWYTENSPVALDLPPHMLSVRDLNENGVGPMRKDLTDLLSKSPVKITQEYISSNRRIVVFHLERVPAG